MKGKLITFEGIDFSGKSVQARILYDRLLREWAQGEKDRVLMFREPGGTAISERIRDILLDRSLTEMDPVTELLLYSAARSQLITEKIIPALQAGKIVICDRFYDSSTAYQGYGRGISLDIILQAHRIATHGVKPDLTLVIDLDPAKAAERQRRSARKVDRMEAEDRDFYIRVREGFLKIAGQEPDRVKIIAGNRRINEIAEEVWATVQPILPKE